MANQLVFGSARRLVRILALMFIVQLVGACGEGFIGPICTLEARVSVVVTVIDQTNNRLEGATATWQVNGGPTQVQSCDQFGIGNCLLAYEVSGVFTFAVSKPGYTPASGTATVKRDECHVITEYMTVVLQPVT